jgi:hypothetical protein
MSIKLGEATKDELYKWMDSIPDPQERTRLRIRLKKKHKDVWGM